MSRLLPIVFLLLAVSACVPVPIVIPTGGGSSGASEASVTRAAVPRSGASINSYRAEAGRASVNRLPKLDAVARRHAADMAARGQMTHRGSDGSTHTQRLRRAGCPGGAENIAAGPYTEATVMAAWMSNPGHRRNILLPAVESYGLANVGGYWSLVLARSC